MATPDANCQRWMWIELIGFDNEEADYRVQTFLDNAGFLPDAISFLLTCPDILHLHDGMEREIVLTPDLCARGGRAASGCTIWLILPSSNTVRAATSSIK